MHHIIDVLHVSLALVRQSQSGVVMCMQVTVNTRRSIVYLHNCLALLMWCSRDIEIVREKTVTDIPREQGEKLFMRVIDC